MTKTNCEKLLGKVGDDDFVEAGHFVETVADDVSESVGQIVELGAAHLRHGKVVGQSDHLEADVVEDLGRRRSCRVADCIDQIVTWKKKTEIWI